MSFFHSSILRVERTIGSKTCETAHKLPKQCSVSFYLLSDMVFYFLWQCWNHSQGPKHLHVLTNLQNSLWSFSLLLMWKIKNNNSNTILMMCFQSQMHWQLVLTQKMQVVMWFQIKFILHIVFLIYQRPLSNFFNKLFV